MKRITIISLLLLVGFAAKADQRSAELLGKMASAIKGMKSYRVEFTLQADAQTKPVKGVFTVSGESYNVAAGGMEVFSDGKTKYEVNPADREVVIDKMNAADKSILGNPAKVFDFPDEAFYHNYGDAVVIGGRAADVINIFPVGDTGGLTQAALWIDAQTRLPLQVTYRMEGVSAPVKVVVDSVTPLDKADEALFRFDKAKYKGYEIIDFR